MKQREEVNNLMKKKPLLMGVLSALVAVSAGQAADIVDAEKTAANWKKNCLSCHGKDGEGKTKAGRKAKVKDLTDVEYQKKFTDEKMFSQIKLGMKDDNGKELMKAYGDKLKDAEIKDLVAFVRKLQKPVR